MKKAFTLIELLLVIGIIATLAGIVIGAVNPQVQLANAQDAKRRANAHTLQKALQQYVIANGTLPDSASYPVGSAIMICTEGVTNATCVRLDDDLVPTYIAQLPRDTMALDANHSGFTIERDAQGRPLVKAAYVETIAGGSPSDYVARWPLQDNAASTVVASSNDMTGSLQGGDTTAVLSTTGPGGNYPAALQFDGSLDYINAPVNAVLNASDLGNQTLTAWIKIDQLPPGTLVTDNNYYYGILIKAGYHDGMGVLNNGKIQLGHWNSAMSSVFSHDSTGSITAGAWYHVAGVLNNTSGTISVYINGTLNGSTAMTANSLLYNHTTTPWRIGVAGPGAAQYRWAFDGAIADARVYNRALSASEIAALAAGL